MRNARIPSVGTHTSNPFASLWEGDRGLHSRCLCLSEPKASPHGASNTELGSISVDTYTAASDLLVLSRARRSVLDALTAIQKQRRPGPCTEPNYNSSKGLKSSSVNKTEFGLVSSYVCGPSPNTICIQRSTCSHLCTSSVCITATAQQAIDDPHRRRTGITIALGGLPDVTLTAGLSTAQMPACHSARSRFTQMAIAVAIEAERDSKIEWSVHD